MKHAPKSPGNSSKRRKRNLIVLGSAAVLAIYAAGYQRTAAAANRMAANERRRPDSPDTPRTREQVPLDPLAAAATVAASVTTAADPSPVPASVPVARVVAADAPAPAIPAPPPAAPPIAPAAAVVANPVPIPQAPPAPAVMAALPSTPPTASSAPGATAGGSTAAALQAVAGPKWKDGAWFGWGYCRHGELKVIVVIKDGRIESADISECYTRYSKNVIAALPKQVVARQSANVDWVSGATQSADAFYYAVVEALKAATAALKAK